ncbi:hypothetical protein GCM10023200_52770 [Actinomycetospora chlora]|uniref:CD-NTase associated protein 4-like DNA endonuclease domain-containing protein n=1 Tax=Actinomycetospora chlora TaxID=663608 RepID=A0ABP9CIC5_9PSEU
MTLADTDNPFDASATALGYAYQFRYALSCAFDKLRTGYDWTIRIEAADDVEVVGSSTRELRQLKQVKRTANLTDLSEDLWKTLRIWAQLVGAGKIHLPKTVLFLITTGQVPPSSIASKLQGDSSNQDLREIDRQLIEAGKGSKNQTVMKALAEYTKLDDSVRVELLSSVRVLNSQSDVHQLRDKLLGDLRAGTREEHVPQLLERIEGWWFQACLECLAKTRDGITGPEFDVVLTDARDRFRPDNLPVDPDLVQAESPELESFEDRIFVKQIELGSRNRARIQAAVRDYLRASSQRSRWARKNLLVSGELEDYERLLREEWELVFNDCCDELPEGSDEEAKARIARKMIGWAEQARFPIRPFCTEPFISRGSYHMLADELAVGWHPEYMVRLMAIVESGSGSGS